MGKINLLKLLVFLSISSLSTNASAYTTWTCLGEKLKWKSNTITMRAAKRSFPTGAWRDSLATSVSRWNDNPSKFQFNLTYNDTSVGFKNNQNEVWFTNDDSILNGAPARTKWRYKCYKRWWFGWKKVVKMVEADIFFDNRVSYTTSMYKKNLWGYGGSRRPFQTTALHELGHALSLAHENRTYNIMGQDWTHIHVNGNTARAYVGEDASHGTVYLYGTTGSSREDLSVTHWKYKGSSGEYSTHTKTHLLDNSGTVLNFFDDSGETRYRVNLGQTVKLELTYENNGKNTRTTLVGYYISTNSTITTLDRLIETRSLSLGRDRVHTTTTTLTIPCDLDSGKNYWIGAIVDKNDVLSEVSESNNATYLPIKAEGSCRIGSGDHWVDNSVSDTDEMTTGATLKVSMGKDCEGDSFEAIFMGPTFVYRGDPVDFINHPLLGLVGEFDQHNDVIETEISSLTLNGGQMTIRAGDGSGNLLDDGPNPPSTRTLYSPGAIHELPDDPSSAESFFHIFLEIDTPEGTFHNKDAFIVQSVIQELPPFKIKYKHELSEPISLYDGNNNKVACLENATHTPTDPFCSFYAVHDNQLNNSQFFLLNQDTFNAVPMGPMHLGQDIEGLDIHPKTGVLYASSGDDTSKPGHLYQGVLLTHIGNIMSEGGYDYKEVDGLSFNPETKELWGWAQNEGLLKIDITTAKATLIKAYPGEVEDLTWNVSGTTLYAVENLHDDHDVDSHGPVDFEKGVRLLSYDGNQVQETCPELMKQFQEIEALETLSDDLLLVGYHGSNTLKSGVIDLINCKKVVGRKILIPYNDVEGIAWPASQCD